ncbi:unnamed protein product [Phytophthora fragariaefolia]|uniref:Unnamed protein product n=1 Tax=Phytophthora fragariaefolia TaxID=1490495 RepID=A0A9W7CVT5_9STRA|nr:unnamed protein product [Phytophthora fragariaefolia]
MESVRRLLLAATCEEEKETLRLLYHCNVSSRLDLALLNCESPVLSFDVESQNRGCSQSLLDDLLVYLAVRKHGARADPAEGNTILGIEQNTVDRWGQREGQDHIEFQNCADMLHRCVII